jgi:hypothetical protein
MKPKYTMDAARTPIPEVFRFTINYDDPLTDGWGSAHSDGSITDWVAVAGGSNFSVLITQCGYYDFDFNPEGFAGNMKAQYTAVPLFWYGLHGGVASTCYDTPAYEELALSWFNPKQSGASSLSTYKAMALSRDILPWNDTETITKVSQVYGHGNQRLAIRTTTGIVTLFRSNTGNLDPYDQYGNGNGWDPNDIWPISLYGTGSYLLYAPDDFGDLLMCGEQTLPSNLFVFDQYGSYLKHNLTGVACVGMAFGQVTKQILMTWTATTINFFYRDAYDPLDGKFGSDSGRYGDGTITPLSGGTYTVTDGSTITDIAWSADDLDFYVVCTCLFLLYQLCWLLVG